MVLPHSAEYAFRDTGEIVDLDETIGRLIAQAETQHSDATARGGTN
jgi:hypothetical protein